MDGRKMEILNLLRNDHKGEEKAIHSAELERLFSLSGRGVRSRISELRREGYPICSSDKGYFYAETQKEINSTVRHLNEFLTGVSNSRTGLMYATVIPPSCREIEIIIRLKGGDDGTVHEMECMGTGV